MCSIQLFTNHLVLVRLRLNAVTSFANKCVPDYPDTVVLFRIINFNET